MVNDGGVTLVVVPVVVVMVVPGDKWRCNGSCGADGGGVILTMGGGVILTMGGGGGSWWL